jgi:hypothetical protein
MADILAISLVSHLRLLIISLVSHLRFLIRFHGNYKNLNVEIHIIHNAFPGKTFERKCKESGKGKQKFDIGHSRYPIL